MADLAEYFKKNRHQPKFQVGDKVTGVYKGIRWVGKVGMDTLINEEDGPVLHVWLYLPLKIDGKVTNHLVTKHRGVKKLVSFG